MESQGMIEFRYADGRVVTGDYAQHARRRLNRGDQVEHDGASWQMYDREDRDGVTVHLFSLVTEIVTAPPRARAHGNRRS